MAYFKSLDHVIAALALASKAPQRANAFLKKALASPDLGRTLSALESYQQGEFAKLARTAKAKGMTTAALLARNERADKITAAKAKAKAKAKPGKKMAKSGLEDFDSVMNDLTVESNFGFDEDEDQDASMDDGLSLDDISEDLEDMGGTDVMDMDLGESLEDVALDEDLEDGLDTGLEEGLEFSANADVVHIDTDMDDDENMDMDMDDEETAEAEAEDDEEDMDDEDEAADEDEEDKAEARVQRVSRAAMNQRALARLSVGAKRKTPGRR